MIEYFLGFIIGILSVLIFLILDIYWQTRGLKRVDLVHQIEEKIKPRKGAILEAPTDEEAAREEIIKKNEKLGLDTKIEDL